MSLPLAGGGHWHGRECDETSTPCQLGSAEALELELARGSAFAKQMQSSGWADGTAGSNRVRTVIWLESCKFSGTDTRLAPALGG